MHAHIYFYIKEQLTEFEHEPATLGERCTVTSAIVFCFCWVLLVLFLLKLRIQGLRYGLHWPPRVFPYPLLSSLGLCVSMSVYGCMLSQVLGKNSQMHFHFVDVVSSLSVVFALGTLYCLT